MGDAFYIEAISRNTDTLETTLVVMRLPESRARRKADLLQQVFAENGSYSATYRDLNRRCSAITGPTELYDVPPGDYKPGQVLRELPTGSKLFVPQSADSDQANA